MNVKQLVLGYETIASYYKQITCLNKKSTWPVTINVYKIEM